MRQQSACPTCSSITSPRPALSAPSPPSPTESRGGEFPHQSVELWVPVGSREGVYKWQLKWKQDHSPCTFWRAQPLCMRVTAGRALPVRSDDMMCDLAWNSTFWLNLEKEAERRDYISQGAVVAARRRSDPAVSTSCSLFQPHLGVAV